MSTTMATLVTRLTTDNKQFSKGMRGARTEIKSLARTALNAAAPLAAMFGARATLQAAQTQIRAEQKLAAVLKATGHAAGLSAAEIHKLAAARQEITNFGDEATIAGAAVLATFKEIKGSVFQDAIIAAQDMSEVMETDLKASIVQIGKALNDPIRGVSALSEVGVSFTDQQREMIKALQESGDIMGAQRVILAELQGEFGGSAEAMADSVTQLTNKFANMAEIVGKNLVPAMNALNETVTQENIDKAGGFLNTMLEESGLLARAGKEDEDSTLNRVGRFAAAASPIGFAASALFGGSESEEITANPFTGEKLPGVGDPLRIGDAIDPAALTASPTDHLRRQQREQAQGQLGGAIGEGLMGGMGFLNEMSGAWGQFTDDMQASFEKQKAEQEKWIGLQEEAADLFDRTRTPMERFEAEQQRLLKLYESGAIDADLFQRGITLAGEGLPDDEVRGGGEIGGVAAVDARSSEAFSAIQAAIRGSMKDPTQEKILKAEEKAARALASIEQNTRNLGGGQEVDI